MRPCPTRLRDAPLFGGGPPTPPAPAPARRRGFSLAEIAVVLAISAIGAAVAIQAWQRSQEAALLAQARLQTAAILRDAVLRAQQSGATAGGQWWEWHVMFSIGSGVVQEYATGPSVGWAPSPIASVTLPGGVIVSASTFPGCGASCASAAAYPADVSVGVYQAIGGIATPGSVTLRTPHGMTTSVNLSQGGTVWYY